MRYIQVMVKAKYMLLMESTRQLLEKSMIELEESNNQSMIMKEASMICDNNQ